MKYEIDLDKIRSEISDEEKYLHTDETIQTEIHKNLNNHIFIEGVLVGSEILDILYSSASFSCPETKIYKDLLLVGSFIGNDVYVDYSGFLKANEYTILNDSQYIQHIKRIKLNQKLKKVKAA